MTLEPLRNQHADGPPLNIQHYCREVENLITRVEEVVKEMREKAKFWDGDYYQGFAAEWAEDWADELEGKE